MAVVKVAKPLRKFIGNEDSIVVKSIELFDVLKEIDGKYPHFLSKVCDTDGKIYPYLDLFVNDICVDRLRGVKMQINDKDVICIIPAVNN